MDPIQPKEISADQGSSHLCKTPLNVGSFPVPWRSNFNNAVFDLGWRGAMGLMFTS